MVFLLNVTTCKHHGTVSKRHNSERTEGPKPFLAGQIHRGGGENNGRSRDSLSEDELGHVVVACHAAHDPLGAAEPLVHVSYVPQSPKEGS